MRKPGYTIERHFALGARLAEMRDAMLTESVSLSKAYPLNDKAAAALRRAVGTLDKARSALDSTICRENPRVDNSMLRAYYPAHPGRRT